MYKIYQVEYGDTIESIANKSKTSIENIKKINSIMNNSDLIVGSLIIIPNVENEIFDRYVINRGDSIYSIARDKNIDPELILLINGLDKSDVIYPDQEILIPKENIMFYVTQEGDTVNSIINKFKIDSNKLVMENDRIFVLEDQLLIHKKEIK